MNDTRRKEIEKARGLLDEAKGILEACRDEEQDYKDNLPENMQGGDKGERADAAIDCLDTAVSTIEDIVLDEATQ